MANKQKYNIGDSVHIVEVNESGVVTGLVPGGYAIRTIKGEQIYPESSFTFNKIIEQKDIVNQEQVKTNLDNAHVFNWNEIPGVWKKYKNPGDVTIADFDVFDKGISKLADIYCGKDNLRPSMSAVEFSDDGIAMTDAHKLLYISGKVKRQGTYACSKFAVKMSNELDTLSEKEKLRIRKVSEKYPNWKAVIPTENDKVGIIHIDKFLSYLRSTENYRNKATNQVKFAFGRDYAIGFNGEFLADIVGSFYSLGYERIHIGLSAPNRPAIFSPSERVAKSPTKYIGVPNTMIALCMPVMLHSADDSDVFYGAEDLDYSTENLTYYDFQSGEIHNHDGSIANYNPNEPAYTDILTEEQIGLIKVVINDSKNTFPILDTTKIVNGVAHLEKLGGVTATLKVSNKIVDGCYLYLDGYLRKSDFNVDDFPMLRDLKEDMKSFAITDVRKFAERLDFATNFVGNDELRPVLMTVDLRFSNNNVKFVSTDAYTLYNKDFAIETKNIYKGSSEFSFPLENPKLIAKLLNSVEHESKIIFTTMDKGYMKIELDNMTIYVRKYDGAYPNTDSVTPKSYIGAIITEGSDFSKLIPKEKKDGVRMLFDGKYINLEDSNVKVKVSNDIKYQKPKEINTQNGIYVVSSTLKIKKIFSSISGSLSGYYYLRENKYFTVFFPLEDYNLPFNKTKPFKRYEVVKDTEFAPKPKHDAKKVIEKTTSVDEVKKEWQDAKDFANMMITSTKGETKKEWMTIIELTKLFI